MRTPSRASVVAVCGLTAAILASTTLPVRAAEDSLDRIWTRYGTGMVTELAIAGGGAEGVTSLIVGGRGVGSVVPESLRDGRFRWVYKWQGANPWPGDSETVLDMRVADLNGDGVEDVIAGGSLGVFAIDGRDGDRLWRARDEGGSPFSKGAFDLVTTDLNRDGVQDVAFADLVDDRVTAVDGRDGSPLWTYPRNGATSEMAAADLNLDGWPDVVIVGGVDEGNEVHAISGATGGDGTARSLWTRRFPAGSDPRAFGDPRVVAIGQVDASTPWPEVVVAGSDGNIDVLGGRSGSPLAKARAAGAVSDVAIVNMDADADGEFVVSIDFPTEGTLGSVQGFDANASHLWTLSTPGAAADLEVADLNGDGRQEILAVGGSRGPAPPGQAPGFALALAPRSGSRAPALLWSRDLPEYAARVVFGPIFGAPTVAVGGGEDGGVWGLDPDGRRAWFFRTGGRVEEVIAADLQGDGIPEVIEGADDATVAVSDSDGGLLWAERVPGRESPDVISLAVGDLTSAGGTEVAAGTWEFDFEGPRGRVHLYSAGGKRLWSVDLAGSADALLAADLEGDGKSDLVVATSVEGSAVRLDGAGHVVWKRRLDTGQFASMALVDANGDGVLDVIVSSKVLLRGDLYALDGADGRLLWHRGLPTGVNWLSTTGRPRDGIAAGDLAGSVYRFRAATGHPMWVTGPVGSSWDGEWSIDADGDAMRDVVSAYEDGNARMLSGRTGEIIWTSPSDGQPGLTVTTGAGRFRPWVAMGTYGPAPITPAGVFVFDAHTGQRVGTAAVESMVLALHPASLDGRPGQELLAGAGWQIHAFDVP